MKIMKPLILALIPLLLITGCATSYDNRTHYGVTADGITNPDTEKGETFVIAPLNEGIDKSDLQFREYAKYVSRAMAAQGFIEGNDPLECDFILLLAYGISDPEERQVTYNQPIFGQTGVSSKTTTGNMYGSASTWGNTTSGSANYSDTTTYTPSYGITGYIPQTVNITRYHRYIYLYAQDWREDVDSAKRLRWKLHIDSTGSSGDLRKVFPVILSAAQQYLGQNTQGDIELKIFEDDPRINVIKGLVQPETANAE